MVGLLLYPILYYYLIIPQTYFALANLIKEKRQEFSAYEYFLVYVDYLEMLKDFQAEEPEKFENSLMIMLADGKKNLGNTEKVIRKKKQTAGFSGDALKKELSMMTAAQPSQVPQGMALAAVLAPHGSTTAAIGNISQAMVPLPAYRVPYSAPYGYPPGAPPFVVESLVCASSLSCLAAAVLPECVAGLERRWSREDNDGDGKMRIGLWAVMMRRGEVGRAIKAYLQPGTFGHLLSAGSAFAFSSAVHSASRVALTLPPMCVTAQVPPSGFAGYQVQRLARVTYPPQQPPSSAPPSLAPGSLTFPPQQPCPPRSRVLKPAFTSLSESIMWF
ncbi:hypothetical protein M422DRAFT_272307 [Sphaerobolus stellatus SS14]|uniref:Uncharacterized protein n=1 Tax=Sphaerobolus stellatus (strain SS14) TaxID=990650 RepID=A0A0C9TBT9_SPHS4|nr:hypothetical protein M422DRAFT_272307 [Sphaerobolus stellatus SS14]